MKKSLLSILLVVFLAVISGCADTGSGTETGTGGGNYDLSAIPVDDTVFNFTKADRTLETISISNPRTDSTKTYYPILISPAMGMNGEADLSGYGMGIIKGVGYEIFFGSNQNIVQNKQPDLTYSSAERNLMYNLTSATSINAGKNGTYYLMIEGWNAPEFPTEGILVFAFLTKEEAAKYIPDNKNIIFLPESPNNTAGFVPSYLDAAIVNELNKLGALRQYKFNAK